MDTIYTLVEGDENFLITNKVEKRSEDKRGSWVAPE
jgi:hypothetical protein